MGCSRELEILRIRRNRKGVKKVLENKPDKPKNRITCLSEADREETELSEGMQKIENYSKMLETRPRKRSSTEESAKRCAVVGARNGDLARNRNREPVFQLYNGVQRNLEGQKGPETKLDDARDKEPSSGARIY